MTKDELNEAAIALAEAASAWTIDMGVCHFCDFDTDAGRRHHADCPVPVYEAAKVREGSEAP